MNRLAVLVFPTLELLSYGNRQITITLLLFSTFSKMSPLKYSVSVVSVAVKAFMK